MTRALPMPNSPLLGAPDAGTSKSPLDARSGRAALPLAPHPVLARGRTLLTRVPIGKVPSIGTLETIAPEIGRERHW